MTLRAPGWDFECGECGRRHHFDVRPSGDEVVCPFCDFRQHVDHPHQTIVFSTTGSDLWDDSRLAGAEPEMLRHTAVFQPDHLPSYRLSEADAKDPAADFVILCSLGRGGMGEIFQARQCSVERTVALKMIRSDLEHPDVARTKFMSEVAVSSWLEHPNIVPIHQMGTDQDGAPFYTMRQIVGVPWSAVMRDRSLQDNLGILLRVCDAVSFAHAHGILHRDLKPSNVMLGEFGETIVMDWGIAVALDPETRGDRLRFDNAIAGSPSYMAPEMAAGDITAISYHSDVYLLGAILFKIVTGKTPHVGRTATDCIEAAADNVLIAIADEWRGELLDVALRAIAGDPAKRFPDVRALSRAIRDYREHHESLQLTERADADLHRAREDADYELFNRAMIGYENAAAVWPANPRAGRGREQARLAYARCAYARDDLELAESLLDPDQAEHAKLLAGIRAALEKREALEAIAERERRLARWEAARNRTTAAYLLDILAQAAPDKLGPNATILQAMDAAGTDIDSRFADDPDHLAGLHLILGTIERDIERLDRAGTHLRRAGDLLIERYGDAGPQVAAWRNEWGQYLLAAGRLEEAERSFAEVLAAMQRIHDKDHPDLLAAMNNLANVYLHQDRYREAGDQYRQLVEVTVGAHGPGHPTSLVARANLARTLHRSGAATEAEQLSAAVLADQLEVLGPRHPHTLATRSDLAMLCYRQGRFEAARDHYHELLAARRALYGEHSAEATATAIDLAKLQLATGDMEAAAGSAAAALAIHPDREPPDPAHRAEALLLMAEVRLAQGRAEEAAGLAAEAADLPAGVGDAGGGAVLVRGLALAAGGDLESALPLACDGAARQFESLGPEDPRVVQSMRRLADLVTAARDQLGPEALHALGPDQRGVAGLSLLDAGATHAGRELVAGALTSAPEVSPGLARILESRLQQLPAGS